MADNLLDQTAGRLYARVQYSIFLSCITFLYLSSIIRLHNSMFFSDLLNIYWSILIFTDSFTGALSGALDSNYPCTDCTCFVLKLSLAAILLICDTWAIGSTSSTTFWSTFISWPLLMHYSLYFPLPVISSLILSECCSLLLLKITAGHLSTLASPNQM